MELISWTQSLKVLDDLSIRSLPLASLTVTQLKLLMLRSDVREAVQVWLDLYLCSLPEEKAIEISANTFLAAFIVVHHPGEVINRPDLSLSQKIQEAATELIEVYDELFVMVDSPVGSEMELSEEYRYTLSQFEQCLREYAATFQEWKQLDVLQVVEELTKLYWDLELEVVLAQKREDPLSESEKQHVKAKQHQIKQQIQKVAGEKGTTHFENFTPIIFEESAVQQIQQEVTQTYQKAYWDMIKEQLENQDYELLLKLLEEVRNKLVSYVPNRSDLRQQLEDRLDVQFLRQMINHQALEKEEIYCYLQYLTQQVRSMQAPADNAETDSWWGDMESKYQAEDFSYATFFPIFFQGVYQMLEKIELGLKTISSLSHTT